MDEAPRFGDGVELPKSAIKPYDRRNPTLEETYPLALAAQAAGEPYVFVTTTADGRPWAQWIVAFGVRGMVVRRFYRPTTAADAKVGRPVDSGTVETLVVRFAVVEVLLAAKRDFLRRTNTNSAKLPVNRRRRRRAVNVKIR